MAYNPGMYMPQNYQYGYQQGMQQMPYSGYGQMNMQPVNGLVSVTGMDGAKAYQMPPNSKMPLFDESEDLLYLKTTDAAGYPTVKTFRFEPVEQRNGYQQGDFVTRQEYNDLLDRLNAIENPPRTTRSRRNSDAE